MAKISVHTSTNADGVWLWELLKKLGYNVEVVFDCTGSHSMLCSEQLLQQSEGIETISKKCDDSREAC